MVMYNKHEYAVIGHALESVEYYNRLMAEFKLDHFKQEGPRLMFECMLKDFDVNKRTRFDDLNNYSMTRDDVMIAFTEKMNSADPDKDFEHVKKEYRKTQYRIMASALHALVVGKDFEEEQAEEIISKYSQFGDVTETNEYSISTDTVADKALKAYEERRANPGVVQGVSLSFKTKQGAIGGFKSLDDTLYGLKGGDLIMFAAQSGHGKTALAMNLTRIISFHNNKWTYYLNTEMEDVQMYDRWTAMTMKIDYTRINNGTTTDEEDKKYREFNQLFRVAPVTLSRIPSLSPNLVQSLIRREMRKQPIDCVIVDYIGRMDTDSNKNLQEWQAMSENTKRLKEIATLLKVPIIVLAQLNEDGSLQGAKKMRNECDGLFYFRPKKIEKEDELGEKYVDFSDTEYFMVKEKVRRSSSAENVKYQFIKEIQYISEV